MLKPNYLGFLQKAAVMPLRTVELLRALVRIGDFSAMDIGVGLAEALPTGLYSGAGSATTSRGCSPTPGAPTTSACSSASCT